VVSSATGECHAKVLWYPNISEEKQNKYFLSAMFLAIALYQKPEQ
jgi:hypothetical protein